MAEESGMTGLWDLLTGGNKKMNEQVDATVIQAKNIYNHRGTLPPPGSPGQLILYKRAAEKAAQSGDFDLADFINSASLPAAGASAATSIVK